MYLFRAHLTRAESCSARLKSLVGCGCKKTQVSRLNKGISCQEKGTKTAVLSRVAKLRSVVARVGYRFFFRYRCQIDTFTTVPVPKPILMKKIIIIIGLAISTKHMGPVSQTHRQGLD